MKQIVLDWGLKGCVWLTVFLSPVKDLMFSVLVLVLADLITGVWAAKKRGECLTSRGLRSTIAKVISYQLAMILSWIVEAKFLPLIPITKAVAGLIAITELKSNLENLHCVTGLNLWERVQELLKPKKE